MPSIRTLRRFCPWLLGLFILAQVAGVVPLVIQHLQHAFESEQDAADDAAQGGVAHVHQHHTHQDHFAHRGGDHEHGAGDPNDQCCTLHHHLTGVVPFTPPIVRYSLVIGSATPLLQRPPVSNDPGLPERPPKSALRI